MAYYTDSKTGKTTYVGETMGEFQSRMQANRIAERGLTDSEKRRISSSGGNPAQVEADMQALSSLSVEDQQVSISTGVTKPSQYYATVFDSTGDIHYRYTNVDAQGVTNVKDINTSEKQVSVFSMRNIYASQDNSQQSLPLGVYDNVRQQSRRATAFEEMYISDFEKSQSLMSPANQGQGVNAQSLISDPKNKYVYFRGENAVMVISEVTPVSKPSGTVSEFTFGDKVRGKLSAYGSAFKQGFLFESERNYMLESGDVTLANTAGQVAGIATLSPGLWENVGVKAGGALYRNAEVFNVAQKVFRVAESPVGKTLITTGFVFYGASKIQSGVQAYQTDGSLGLAREGLIASREVVSVVSFTKGLGIGISEAQKNVFYGVRGQSSASTVVEENTFETAVNTQGKIFEFNPDASLRRNFVFKDFSALEGSRAEIANVRQSFKTPFGERTQITSTNIVDVYAKGETFIASPKGERFFSAFRSSADVKALSVSKETVLTEAEINGRAFNIGQGSQRFQFREGKEVMGVNLNPEFKFDTVKINRGLGKSDYTFSDFGDVVRVKGRSASLDAKVTSRLDFSETIVRVNPGDTSFEFGSGLSLQQEALGRSTGQRVVSQLQSQDLAFDTPTFQQIKAVQAVSEPVLQPPNVRMDISAPSANMGLQSESFAVAEPKPASRSRMASVSKQTQVFDVEPVLNQRQSSFLIQGGRSRSRSSFGSEASMRSFEVQDQEFKPAEALAFGSRFRVEQSRKQDLNLRQVSIQQARQGARSSFMGFGPEVPIIEPPLMNLPVLPKKSEGKKQRSQGGFSFFDPGYSSSVEANLLDISGPKPSKFEIESGLFVRPKLRR